ncbi:DUF1488 family protein [Roseateles violae]|uniref:DUF1488 family protein n=1 Tax=Roseateles violae TaxID=3058042 RepID=A0ABT8E0D5_9BURK|nr:DUF1488 family protein [Pelomonas sp. PFR6]MDN3923270.1 DUF1488 family protein [Pelomonas sp. PFR6]
MAQPPFFHEASGAVRFWVRVDGALIGASISRETLHHRFRPGVQGDEPLDTYLTFASVIQAAVASRVAQGSIEPVMLREFDLNK